MCLKVHSRCAFMSLFLELLRQDEYQTVNGRTVTIDDRQVYVFATTDYVEVNCDGKAGRR